MEIQRINKPSDEKIWSCPEFGLSVHGKEEGNVSKDGQDYEDCYQEQYQHLTR